MSLTSYRTAPPRVTYLSGFKRQRLHPQPRLSSQKLGRPVGLATLRVGWPRLRTVRPRDEKAAARFTPAAAFETVNGFPSCPPAVMPGDDLLFQRFSVSTIGAVRFHGRVRDGIGWVTDAMVTKQ